MAPVSAAPLLGDFQINRSRFPLGLLLASDRCKLRLLRLAKAFAQTFVFLLHGLHVRSHFRSKSFADMRLQFWTLRGKPFSNIGFEIGPRGFVFSAFPCELIRCPLSFLLSGLEFFGLFSEPSDDKILLRELQLFSFLSLLHYLLSYCRCVRCHPLGDFQVDRSRLPLGLLLGLDRCKLR